VRLICGWGKETDLNHLSIAEIQKKKRIQNQFYLWFLLKASGLQFMVWQINPIKIYLTVTFFCPPEKCGLMYLLK